MLNSRILDGTFCCNNFLPGDSNRRASCRTRATHFLALNQKLRNTKRSNFPLVNLICFAIISSFFLKNECCLYKETAFLSTQVGWHTDLPRFQGARPDHVRVESSSCCFPREFRRRKPSTCRATLFRCKFLSMFRVFHLA